VIAALQEKDEEDHGEEATFIILARFHKNSKKSKKWSSDEFEGSGKGTKCLYGLGVLVRHFAWCPLKRLAFGVYSAVRIS
jgi:hypothetical protein